MTETLLLTVKLAFVTTAILLLVGTPLAWWLSRRRTWVRETVVALVSLPIVLPPTVLGFYLLLLLSPEGPLAAVTRPLGLPALAFTFPGLVAGSVVYSLPFAVTPIRNAFIAVGERPLEADRKSVV